MATKHKQLGYKFEHEFDEGLQLAGFERDRDFFKIPDARAMSRLTTIRSPCDFVVFAHDGDYFFELKQTSSKRLPFRNIKPHQIEAMARAKRGYFIIDFKYTSRQHKVLAVPGKLMQKLAEKKMASINMNDLAAMDGVIELFRCTRKNHPTNFDAFIDVSNLQIMPLKN